MPRPNDSFEPSIGSVERDRAAACRRGDSAHIPGVNDASDDDLLEAARSGDSAALGRLLDRAAPRIFRFGMKMCGDPEDAKDVLQETLLAASRNVRSFRGDSALSTWLFTIARSFCLKKRRRSKFAPPEQSLFSEDIADETAALEDPAHTPEQASEQRELGAALEQAIRALNPAYREVLVLRDVEGLSAPEVAGVLGTSVEAVKSRLHRARLFVRERVEPWLGPPPEAAGAACPDVLRMLSEHEEGDISAEVCAEMERHLEGCPHCRGACDTLKRTLALCRTSPSADVPTDVQEAVRRALRAVRIPAEAPPR